jgi:hypothetical protein
MTATSTTARRIPEKRQSLVVQQKKRNVKKLQIGNYPPTHRSLEPDASLLYTSLKVGIFNYKGALRRANKTKLGPGVCGIRL